MVNKKKYIIPRVEFEEVEQTDDLCGISAWASGQDDGYNESDPRGSSGVKSAFSGGDFFENPLTSSLDQASNDFEYSMNENW